MRKINNKGSSVVITLVVAIVVVAVGASGYFVWHNKYETNGNQTTTTTKKTTQDSSSQQTGGTKQQAASDPSEGGKYLVIKEWGVRFQLPESLQGKVNYSLGDKVVDPDGNNIQAAKILLKNSDVDNQCAVTANSVGSFIDSASQLLQVEKDKTFNATRYKGTFKANLYSDATHVYHLNYITPDCAGPAATAQIKELQTALQQIQSL